MGYSWNCGIEVVVVVVVCAEDKVLEVWSGDSGHGGDGGCQVWNGWRLVVCGEMCVAVCSEACGVRSDKWFYK